MAQSRHPEQGADELFITNADKDTFGQVSWKTKRAGEVAYDTSGKPLGRRWPGSFPVFAKREEIAQQPDVLKSLEAEQGFIS